MNVNSRDIIGGLYRSNLRILSRVVTNRFLFRELPPEGFEINYLEKSFPYEGSGEGLCDYHHRCPIRSDEDGMFEIVRTDDNGITRYFFHKDCLNELVSRTSSGKTL